MKPLVNHLDDYRTYFTDLVTPTESTDHVVGSLEFIHYNTLLRDDEYSDVHVYRRGQESRVEQLLSKVVRVFENQGISINL